MFKSQAQRAKFYSDPKLHKYVKEFEAATPKNKKLPSHVKKTKSKDLTVELGRAFNHIKH